MPAYRNHTVFEIARGVKAFLNLRLGLTRGEVPNLEEVEVRHQIDAENRRIRQLQGQTSAEGEGAERAFGLHPGGDLTAPATRPGAPRG